jgi:hypothetical protein
MNAGDKCQQDDQQKGSGFHGQFKFGQPYFHAPLLTPQPFESEWKFASEGVVALNVFSHVGHFGARRTKSSNQFSCIIWRATQPHFLAGKTSRRRTTVRRCIKIGNEVRLIFLDNSFLML